MYSFYTFLKRRTKRLEKKAFPFKETSTRNIRSQNGREKKWDVCEYVRILNLLATLSGRNDTVYEYLTRTWKYFKRMDVLRLNARPSRGTNGEWYLGAPSPLALLLIFEILYFARQIVPIEINPASWADSCCDNSRPSSTLSPSPQSIPREAKPRANPHRPPSPILPANPSVHRTTTANLILRSSNSFSIPCSVDAPTFPTVRPTYPSTILLSAFALLVSPAICQYFSILFSLSLCLCLWFPRLVR